jgi:ssDNA-binding Zn-finger/Zn-ribbon topoisomerase 1
MDAHSNTSSKDTVTCPDCGKRMVKHIIKEGARYHVTSWNAVQGANCSDKECEINHRNGKCVP